MLVSKNGQWLVYFVEWDQRIGKSRHQYSRYFLFFPLYFLVMLVLLVHSVLSIVGLGWRGTLWNTVMGNIKMWCGCTWHSFQDGSYHGQGEKRRRKRRRSQRPGESWSLRLSIRSSPSLLALSRRLSEKANTQCTSLAFYGLWCTHKKKKWKILLPALCLFFNTFFIISYFKILFSSLFLPPTWGQFNAGYVSWR